jgi:hypothetical protein
MAQHSTLTCWLNVATDRTHAATSFMPRTLCGLPIDLDWQRQEVRDVDESAVECKQCRRALTALAKDGVR